MSFIPLRAGPLSLVFQPRDGSLRYLHCGRHEVLRGIGAPIRDHLWATIPPALSDLVVDQQPDGFRVTFDVRCQADAVDFRWHGEITADATGTLVFRFDGEALNDFQRSRIGFCVLHPAEAAGASCSLEHTDGTREPARFPSEISPHQPFLGLRALTHEFAPGRHAEVRFDGDTFETEDQRNWTDASFKTYCTPLALPRPVLVRRGTRIQQSVTLRLPASAAPAPDDFAFPWQPPATVDLALSGPSGHALPALGCIWNAPATAPAVLDARAPLGLAHLRVELRLADPSFATALRHAAAAASALGTQLEPAIFINDHADQQLTALTAALAALPSPPRIARWLVFHENKNATPPTLIDAVRARLAPTPFAAPIGGGSTDNFTELNREPTVGRVADFTVHACNPQVHAFDPDSIVETLGTQGLTVACARRLSGGRPVVVSPITFTPRWQPGAAGAPAALPAGLMPFRSDPRHRTPFAAAWFLGSIAALAVQGAASATYFEATGPNGILDADATRLPVARVFRLLAPLAGGAVASVVSSHPLRIAALAVATPARRHVLIANLGATPQRVQLRGAWGSHALEVAAHDVHALAL